MIAANRTCTPACHGATTARVPRGLASRAVVALVTAIAIGVFVAAGNWQGRRLEQKDALRAQFEAAQAQPMAALPTPAGGDWTPLRYRNVRVEGRFAGARQILIDNRVHAGRAGFHVVAPLQLSDGRVVLVNRGWVAVGRVRSELPVVPPPNGPTTLVGRIAVPAVQSELRAADVDGPVWQRLDPVRFGSMAGLAVLPIVIEQAPDVTAAGNDGLVRDWPAPDFGAEKHRIYRAQWYAFAALAAGLWCYFNLVRGPRRRGGAV